MSPPVAAVAPVAPGLYEPLNPEKLKLCQVYCIFSPLWSRRPAAAGGSGPAAAGHSQPAGSHPGKQTRATVVVTIQRSG